MVEIPGFRGGSNHQQFWQHRSLIDGFAILNHDFWRSTSMNNSLGEGVLQRGAPQPQFASRRGVNFSLVLSLSSESLHMSPVSDWDVAQLVFFVASMPCSWLPGADWCRDIAQSDHEGDPSNGWNGRRIRLMLQYSWLYSTERTGGTAIWVWCCEHSLLRLPRVGIRYG
jgi:hypothetical protein